MSFQSQGGWVGFKTQSVRGTYASPSTTGVFMKTTGGALTGTRDLLLPDPEIGGIRDETDAYLGPVKFDGEYDFYARMDSFATLLAAAMGGVPVNTALTGGDTGAFRHDLTFIDSGSLPYLSVEENIGDNLDHFRYTDAKVDEISLAADAAGYITGKATMVAITQLAVPSASATVAATAPFDNGPLVVGTNVTVTYNGVTLPAKSVTLDIKNNLDSTDFRLGSLFLGGIDEKRRDVMCTVKIRPQDNLLWRQALYGNSGASSVATGVTTKQQVVITMSTYEPIVGGGTQCFEVQLTAPKAVIKPYKLAPAKDDIIENDLEIQFLRPAVATPLLTCSIWNSKSTVL